MNSINKSKVSDKSQLNFKNFSRKNYAVFYSMHKIIRISTLIYACCIITNTSIISAQSDTNYLLKIIDLEEVEIVGQKSPALIQELPRLVTVLSINESEPAASHSIHDLLQYSSTIDTRQRGKGGIQTDLSIRGGSFDHTLVLFNGIKISDPQTGHLSLFLPVETEAIQRIEILNGPAARVHGTNAFSGVINFVTRPSGNNSIDIVASGGSFGFFNTSLTANLGRKKFKHLFHYNYSRSDGYTYNTDYSKYSIFYQGQFQNQGSILDLQFGYANRAFGANGFYSSALPEQYEQNQMSFASISYKTGSFIKVNPKVYWRRLRDRFEYFREGNEWYRFENGICISNDTAKTSRDTVEWYSEHNHHINDVFGAQLTMSMTSKIGVTTLDWHLSSESIISNNIGYDKGTQIPVRNYPGSFYTKSDSRQNFDIHLEQTITYRKLFIAGGVLVNWNSYLPDEINFFPGIDMRFSIFKGMSLIASYNYSLGLPTFTDLTYKDPDNEGNSDLMPYSKSSIEGGIRFAHRKNISTLNLFYEKGENVIDWVWFEDISKYRPVNVSNYISRGFEISSSHDFSGSKNRYFPIQTLSLNYTFIDMNKEIPGEVTKYFNVRHKFSAMIQHRIINNLIVAWNLSYIDRMGSYLVYNFEDSVYEPVDFDAYWLFDLRISYYWKEITFYTETTNLFDNNYIDIGSINQPGRWLSFGIKYKFTRF